MATFLPLSGSLLLLWFFAFKIIPTFGLFQLWIICLKHSSLSRLLWLKSLFCVPSFPLIWKISSSSEVRHLLGSNICFYFLRDHCLVFPVVQWFFFVVVILSLLSVFFFFLFLVAYWYRVNRVSNTLSWLGIICFKCKKNGIHCISVSFSVMSNSLWPHGL